MDDEWLNVSDALQANANEPAPRNVRIVTNQNGLELSWDSPPTNENVIRYDILCSTISRYINSQHTTSINMFVDGNTLTATVPLRTIRTPEPSDYNCCITAHIQRQSSLILATMSCHTIELFFTPLSSGPIASSQSSTILVLGILAGVFFLALVVVAVVLIAYTYRK